MEFDQEHFGESQTTQKLISDMSDNNENTIFDFKSKNQVYTSMYIERIAIPITENHLLN